MAYFLSSLSKGLTQSHYIEVVHGAICMEQKMRFGLIVSRLAILKKELDRLFLTFEVGYFCFCGQKKMSFFYSNIVASALKSYTVNVLSAEFTDECLRTKFKDNYRVSHFEMDFINWL